MTDPRERYAIVPAQTLGNPYHVVVDMERGVNVSAWATWAAAEHEWRRLTR